MLAYFTFFKSKKLSPPLNAEEFFSAWRLQFASQGDQPTQHEPRSTSNDTTMQRDPLALTATSEAQLKDDCDGEPT